MFELISINETNFNARAIELFHWQFEHVLMYRHFVNAQKIDISKVRHIESIPFLPVQIFKTTDVIVEGKLPEITFFSSGTRGMTSKHLVADVKIYRESFFQSFELFYGKPEKYCILALLPSYLEREGSSLIYMMQALISQSNHPESGFFLNQYDTLNKLISDNEFRGEKTILFGVSYALLDFAAKWTGPPLKNTIIIETGGMKGKRRELLREELHQILKNIFCVDAIHSEYGMTELLSQAYSVSNGLFQTPPWMKVLVRDVYDPKDIHSRNKQGAINIIDLANQYSCAFIATDDLGSVNEYGNFTIAGRADNSDVRGCNLMVY